MHRLCRCSLLLIMLYSNNSLAGIKPALLKQLFDSGDSQAAYDYALSEISKYEGDPTFDYYYGAAAIDIGEANEGVYALERVLVSQPNNHAARLELARGYFILQEYTRSGCSIYIILHYQ